MSTEVSISRCAEGNQRSNKVLHDPNLSLLFTNSMNCVNKFEQCP